VAKGKLTVEQKTYVVQSLACFDTPTAIAAALRKDQDIEITPQSVEAYDPTKAAGASLGKRWSLLFETTRKNFLEDTAGIAISHRAVRLRALQRMAGKAEDKGNMVLAASLMEQAAKEVGESYTNRREVSGKNGGPVQVVFETLYEPKG
jgi:hypothetical protein